MLAARYKPMLGIGPGIGPDPSFLVGSGHTRPSNYHEHTHVAPCRWPYPPTVPPFLLTQNLHGSAQRFCSVKWIVWCNQNCTKGLIKLKQINTDYILFMLHMIVQANSMALSNIKTVFFWEVKIVMKVNCKLFMYSLTLHTFHLWLHWRVFIQSRQKLMKHPRVSLYSP